jgi:hypothetical protein
MDGGDVWWFGKYWGNVIAMTNLVVHSHKTLMSNMASVDSRC